MYVLDWDERLIMDKLVEYFGDEGWKQTTPQLKTVVLSLCGYNDVFDGRESPIWWADEGEREVKHLFADNELQFEVFRHQEHMSIPTEDDDTEDYV
jgi:hypothetical protein